MSISVPPNNNTDEYIQRQLAGPMPWIGMYVAAASLACSVAMATNVFHGFRSKKLWFPCKYFSLNATSLTLLAVAMKLPVDLTTNFWAITDRLAKLSSLALMSIATGNFMISVGSMDDKDILTNVTALAILIVTVFVDVFIQIIQTRSIIRRHLVFPEEVLTAVSMLFLLALLLSSSIMILSTKKYLEAKYQEIHSEALSEESLDTSEFTTRKLKGLVKKYWVMAETGSPQFVIARSATSAASGVICMLIVVILLVAQIRMAVIHKRFGLTASVYGNSTNWILISQSIGVAFGSLAPALRWYIAVNLRCSTKVKDELKIETYWTERLVEWKRSSLPSTIRHLKRKKVLHTAKGYTLNFLVRVQIFIVLSSKLVLLISSFVSHPLVLLFQHLKYLKIQKRINSIPRNVEESGDDNTETDIRRYALKLKGEAELPEKTLESICNEVERVIEIGKKQQPKSLLQLLKKSNSFDGVITFDSNQVPSLHPQEPPNCWSLPLVTLTCISISLPNISNDKVNSIVSSVREGLVFVNLVEKCLYNNGDLMNTREAATIWTGVELHHKWQDKVDLQKISLESRNSHDALQKLSTESEKIVLKFKRDSKDCVMRNPLNWPPNIIAANSMYRISQTISLVYNQQGVNIEEETEDDERLFERLSVMIADILSACLINLTRVITMKCHRNSIEEREKNVREAALLLGETEQVLSFLWHRESPRFSSEQTAAYIEEWRSVMEMTPSQHSGYDHVSIEILEG
ncbi:hypothetical protein BUALT_Bualt14G0040000 [Buddleja alternifolia]|uniref:Uncharacterized protein n=1 Tax=Buddleja alternifolia TaxID=168488 RepID=A0AAV6WGG3_9LAMI|nr:hypothetical protein BUALT_Bualt14G0040000 [Buddleja alternifolia]